MTTQWDTHSEALFCHVCEERLGYGIEKIPETQQKTPDYRVTVGNVVVIAEVKSLEDNQRSLNAQQKTSSQGFWVGEVDFNFTGHLERVLSKQNKQLSVPLCKGLPTLAVIYPERIFGPDLYQVEHALEKSTVEIPENISAVMLMKSARITGEENLTPLYGIYRNSNAVVQFPQNIFPEIYA